MYLGGLIAPDIAEVGAGIEGLEPDFKPKDEGENGADDDGITVNLEEETIRRNGNGREAEEEGDEDEDGVGEGS